MSKDLRKIKKENFIKISDWVCRILSPFVIYLETNACPNVYDSGGKGPPFLANLSRIITTYNLYNRCNRIEPCLSQLSIQMHPCHNNHTLIRSLYYWKQNHYKCYQKNDLHKTNTNLFMKHENILSSQN